MTKEKNEELLKELQSMKETQGDFQNDISYSANTIRSMIGRS